MPGKAISLVNNSPPAVPLQAGKRRLRFWHKLVIVLLTCLIGVAGYRWYQRESIDRELRQILYHLNTNEPGWQKQGILEQHNTLPISQAFARAMAAFPPQYRGWYGDDISYRPGSLPFEMEGPEYAIRLPEPYFQILKERLQDATVSEMRLALNDMLQESGRRRAHFTNMMQVQELRKISNYLRDEMELAAHEKRWHDLPRLMRLQVENAELAGHGPDLISRLVSMACSNNGWSGFYRALALGEMPDKVLQEIDKIIPEIDADELKQLIRVIRADHYHELSLDPNPTLKTALTDYFCNQYSVRMSDSSLQGRLLNAWVWLRVELSLMNTTSTPLQQVMQLHQQALELAPYQPKQLMSLYDAASRSFDQPMTALLMSSANKIIQAGCSEQMMRDMARVGIACERYRLAQGHWPDKLQTLIPQYLKKVPMDPYSDQPVLYQVLPDGVEIYSVWMNGLDDGGNVLGLPVKPMKDKGYRLLNAEVRGQRYEQVYPERKLKK